MKDSTLLILLGGAAAAYYFLMGKPQHATPTTGFSIPLPSLQPASGMAGVLSPVTAPFDYAAQLWQAWQRAAEQAQWAINQQQLLAGKQAEYEKKKLAEEAAGITYQGTAKVLPSPLGQFAGLTIQQPAATALLSPRELLTVSTIQDVARTQATRANEALVTSETGGRVVGHRTQGGKDIYTVRLPSGGTQIVVK